MVNQQELNELYNCLDLYIVSSRIEGGPRAIPVVRLLELQLSQPMLEWQVNL